jgi:hypothetical protein
MNHWLRSWISGAGAVLAVAATLGTLVTIHDAGTASADVCASVGRRVSVSGCANLADVMAPYAPPPDYYAPLPEDYYAPPPPPPPPPVSGCIGVSGRRVSVSGCR